MLDWSQVSEPKQNNFAPVALIHNFRGPAWVRAFQSCWQTSAALLMWAEVAFAAVKRVLLRGDIAPGHHSAPASGGDQTQSWLLNHLCCLIPRPARQDCPGQGTPYAVAPLRRESCPCINSRHFETLESRNPRPCLHEQTGACESMPACGDESRPSSRTSGILPWFLMSLLHRGQVHLNSKQAESHDAAVADSRDALLQLVCQVQHGRHLCRYMQLQHQGCGPGAPGRVQLPFEYCCKEGSWGTQLKVLATQGAPLHCRAWP